MDWWDLIAVHGVAKSQTQRSYQHLWIQKRKILIQTLVPFIGLFPWLQGITVLPWVPQMCLFSPSDCCFIKRAVAMEWWMAVSGSSFHLLTPKIKPVSFVFPGLEFYQQSEQACDAWAAEVFRTRTYFGYNSHTVLPLSFSFTVSRDMLKVNLKTALHISPVQFNVTVVTRETVPLLKSAVEWV